MVCLLSGGFVLDYFKQTYVFAGFIILFSFAFIGRIYSAYLLTKQYEPYFKPDKEFYFTFRQFVKKLPYSNYGKFVMFYSLFSFAVAIASPFFAVYMLKDLQFSYVWFMIVILSETIIKLLFMPLWGKFSDKYGQITIIRICAKIIPLIPLLWVFSIAVFNIAPNFILPYLIFLQIISGIVWGGFDLASSIFIYDAVSREKMALCLAYERVIANILVFVGSLIGGLLATLSINWFWVNAILFVFIISAIARFVVAYFMLPKLTDVRKDIAEFKLILEAEQKLKMFSPKNLINKINLIFKP
jgi:MFS family permease